MTIDWGKELITLGLTPATWNETLKTIENKLSSEDWKTFSRLHKSFASYRTDHTLCRFYNFVFKHDLQIEINQHRFSRMVGILNGLATVLEPGKKILEIGAGTGLIAQIIQQHFSPSVYSVHDMCSEVSLYLSKQGFKTLPSPNPESTPTPTPAFDSPPNSFNFIICADSLGEINADDDDQLSESSPLTETEFVTAFEERYGIAQKLSAWKNNLAADGKVFLWEPLKHRRAWEGLRLGLNQEGWKANLHSAPHSVPFLELSF